ncbi:unnamed protein product [Auanema sp. JU1783]|nr:unnamed protein product [Auanema sp. JU1783]
MLNKMPAWDEEDCSYLLRHMELTTFTNVVTALRAQGILSKSKSAFLESARRIFFIGDELFKAEIRRVANDENLIRIAAVLNPNYDSYADWGLLGAEFEDELDKPQPRLFDSSNSQSVASALLSIADAHNGKVEEDNSSPIFETGQVGCVPDNLRAMFDGQSDVLKKVNDALAKSRKENKEKYDKIFAREKTIEPDDSDTEEAGEVPTSSHNNSVVNVGKVDENLADSTKTPADKPTHLPIEKLRIPIDKIKTPLAKSRTPTEKAKTPSEKARASAEKSKEKSKAWTDKLKAMENAELSLGKASTSTSSPHEKARPKTAAEKAKLSTDPVRSAVDEEVLKLLKRASAESERAEMKAGQNAKQMSAGVTTSQRKPNSEHKLSVAELNVQKELMKRAGEVESAIAKKAAAMAAYKSPIVAKTSSYPSVPVARTVSGVSSVNDIMDNRRIERSAEPSALRKELEKSTEYSRPLAGLTVSADVRRQLEAKTLEARAYEAKSLESRSRESKALEATTAELRALEAQIQESRVLEVKTVDTKSLEAKSSEHRGYDARALDMHTFEAKTLKSFVMEAKALEARALEEKALENRSYATSTGKLSTNLAADPSRRVASTHQLSSSRLESTVATEEEQNQKVAEIMDRIQRRRPKPTEPADKIQLPPSQSRAPPRPVAGFLPVSPRVPNLTITSSSNSPVLPKRPRLSSGSEGTSSPSYPKEYPVMRAPVSGAAAKQKHVPGILQHDGQRKPRTVSQSSSCSYLGPARSSNSPVRPQVRPVGVSSLTISSMNPSMSPQDTGSHHGHGHDYGVSNPNRSHYRPLAMGQHSSTDPYYKSSPPSRQRIPTSTPISFNQNTNLFPVVRRVGQVMFRRDGTGNIISEPSSSQIGRRMGGVGNNVTAASVERMRERMEQPRYEHSNVPSTSPLHTHSSHAIDISNARQLSTSQSRQSHVSVPSVSVEASRPGVSVQANQEVASKDKKTDPMNTKFSR